MTTPTRERIQAFLDDLAMLTAAHGLAIDADVGGHMSLEPTPTALPVGYGSYGGYSAKLRSHKEGTSWWEVGVYETGLPISEGGVASIDITNMSAHQRIAVRAALDRVRSIVRGES